MKYFKGGWMPRGEWMQPLPTGFSNFSLEWEELFLQTKFLVAGSSLEHLSEADKIRKLCHAAESNEKLFWKLVKSQRSSSQMSAFLVNGDLLTDKKAIRAMWADHFEALGTPSEIATFDKGFFTKVTDSVREAFSTFVNDPNGILC